MKSPDRTLPRPIGGRITVYRDDPVWDKHSRWFMVPLHIIRQLYVCTWYLPAILRDEDDEDGDYNGDWDQDSAMLLSKHPDCIFVYSSNED